MHWHDQIFGQLRKLSSSKTLILGIGQLLKGDDGAGPFICKELSGKISAELINAGSVPENYIQPIIKKTPKNLLIVDAVDFGGEPGTIKIFNPEQLNSMVFSTHTLSPHLFIDMIRREISVEVFLLGIQPAQIELGQPLSKPVEGAVRQLCDILVQIFPLEKRN